MDFTNGYAEKIVLTGFLSIKMSAKWITESIFVQLGNTPHLEDRFLTGQGARNVFPYNRAVIEVPSVSVFVMTPPVKRRLRLI